MMTARTIDAPPPTKTAKRTKMTATMYSRQRRGRVAYEGHADVVKLRPLAMMRDGADDGERKRLAGEDAQELGFGEIGVVEGDLKNRRVAFSQERSRQAARTAARQHDSLSKRNLRKARDEQILGLASQFGVNGREQAHLHQIKKVEFTQEAHADQARHARVDRKGALHAVAFQKGLATREFFEELTGELFAFEEQADMALVESRIVEKRQEHVGARVMQKHGEFVGASRAGQLGAGDSRLFLVNHVALACWSIFLASPAAA